MPDLVRAGLGLVPAIVAALMVAPSLAAEASPENIRLVGRFDVEGDRISFEWPGSTLQLRLEASWLEFVATDSGNNSLVAEIDGKPSLIDLQAGTRKYRVPLPEALEPRNVRLIRRTEARFGTTTITDLKTDGSFLAPAANQRSMLVVGDSISAGYGVEGRDTNCPFTPQTENQYLTYAAVAGRRYAADVTTIAVSGIGLVRNFDGATASTMKDMYRRLLPSRPSTAELPSYDVVVVHLGTNDFNNGARPQSFSSEYDSLLEQLRGASPQAMIYAAIGPMLSDEDRAAATKAIGDAVDARRADGDIKLDQISFTDPPGGNSRGCHWHPNERGHQFMADQLSRRLASDIEWAETR